MNVLLLEDEYPAAERLQRLLLQAAPEGDEATEAEEGPDGLVEDDEVDTSAGKKARKKG